MEYFLIALVSTPFLVGIAIILYKTLDFVIAALIILRDFLEDLSLFPHFSKETTCGPIYFQDAEVLDVNADGIARLRLLIDLSEGWRNGAEVDGQFAIFDDYLLSLIAIPAEHPAG